MENWENMENYQQNNGEKMAVFDQEESSEENKN